MKLSEVPDKALRAEPIDIPTKQVVMFDWAKFYEIVERNGFVVVECDEDEIRITKSGAEESVPVKAFNSWTRANFGRHIKSRRLSANRWFVSLTDMSDLKGLNNKGGLVK